MAHDEPQGAGPTRLVIRNIGLLLSGAMEKPILDADTILAENGRITAIGRAKDIISRGGNKIAPLEIDNLLAEHPEITAALCAGVADERLGEVIHAVIVTRAGARLDAAALRDWLLARTERFKVPDVFHFRDALPAGASGKADRRAVAQLAAPTGNRR